MCEVERGPGILAVFGVVVDDDVSLDELMILMLFRRAVLEIGLC